MRRRFSPWLGVVLVAVLSGVALAGAFILWPAPALPAVQSPVQGPELVARGRYVALAADCVACHTTEGGQPYAGGRAFRLPFGVIYAPNITPDVKTGIGSWSDAEFVRALKRGVDPHGRELYPAFPYTSYAGMSEADALALKAYLFSLSPVSARVPDNSLVFPFDQRRLVRFWKLLFFRPPEPSPASADPTLARGAYLVEVLGHCGECHTPRNVFYGVRRNHALAGGTIQGWRAWNISSDPRHGIGAWSTAELVTYLKTGYAPGRASASGPMKEAIDYSLAHLSDSDLGAMAAYLKQTRPMDDGPLPPAGPSAAARRFDATDPGAQLFAGACSGCHEASGDGRQTPAASLIGRRALADPTGLNVVQTILRGGEVHTPLGPAFMPSFGANYSDAEIAAIANHVIDQLGSTRGKVKPRDVARARAQ